MSRLQDRRNAKRVNGLRRDPRTGSGKLAKSERGYGGVLALDFTDNSVALYDPTTQANIAYSQGVTDGNGNFRGPHALLTYTSPSNKLTLQSDGFIKYQAHNLYLNSAAPANQSITVVSGASYAVTITGTVSVTASGAATGTWTAGTNTFTAATTTLTLGSTSGSGTVHVRRTPSNDDYIATAGAAKYALPLEYSATDGSCLGLLVEEARTNVILYNTDLTNASGWQTTLLNASVASTTGPNGLGDAWRITEDSSAATYHRMASQVLTVSATTTYALSCYMKAGTRNYGCLRYYNNSTSSAAVTFDLTNGTVGNTGAAGSAATPTGMIEDAGNGWWRCTMIVATVGNTFFQANILLSDDGTLAGTLPTYDGDGSSYIDVWTPQLEAGSFPTSPILTYGAAATRNADPLSQLSTTFPLSATAGSLYAYVAPYAGADLAGIVSLNDGTGNEEIVIYKDASANIVAQVEDGGVGQLAPLDSTVNASSGTAFKVALAWAANDFALSADGTAAQTDTGGTLPTVTTLEIGVDQANNYFNGHIKAISYVPRRKSDAELQTETA